MNAPQSKISTEALLAHSDWVRELVGSLVFDPSRAEDALQETWLVALEHPPRHDNDLRAWLATVARNAVKRLGRGESRRARREQVAARLEALPDTVDVIEKARLQRSMVDAVLALAEPYRTTLLLRYFEDMKPREIARQLGRPVNTVRTHLERGLAQLRSTLDVECGGREAWGFAFLPLCFDGRSLAARGSLLLKTGGVIMMLKWMVPAAVGLVAIAMLLDVNDDLVEMTGSGLQTEGSELGTLSAVEQFSAPEPEQPGRSPVAPANTDEELAVAAQERHLYAGQLVDITGQALPGEAILVTNPEWPYVWDGWLYTGDMSIKISREMIDALRRSPDHAQQQFVQSLPAGQLPPNVEGLFDPEILEALAAGADASDSPLTLGLVPARVVTDASGFFSTELDFPDGDLHLESERLMLLGHATEQDASEVDGRLLVAALGSVLQGRVLDESGSPLAGARVDSGLSLDSIPGFPRSIESGGRYRSWQTTSDEEGRFSIDPFPIVPGTRLSADLDGYESAWLVLEDESRTSVEITLKKEDRKPVVTGRVLDEHGQGIEGATILHGGSSVFSDEHGQFVLKIGYVWEGEPLVALKPGLRPAVLEDLGGLLERGADAARDLTLRLGSTTGRITGQVVNQDGDAMAGVEIALLNALAYGNTSWKVEGVLSGHQGDDTLTDADGRFELQGLFQDSYDLVVADNATFLATNVVGISPGSAELRVVLDSSTRLPEVSGRVVDRHGQPVPGARLSSSLTLARGEGSRTFRRLEQGRTDERGAFRLTNLPTDSVDLMVHGAGIQDTEMHLDHDHEGELLITVPLLLRFQLDPDIAPDADSYEVVDGEGKMLRFMAILPGLTSHRSRSGFGDRSALPTIEVLDEAAEILFYSGETVIGRRALHLRYGEIVRIR